MKRRTAAGGRRGIDAAVAAEWLVAFLRDELLERRGIPRAVIGLSGGVDSAVTAFLCARALGAENVYAVRLPYATSSPSSLADAQLVVDALRIHCRTIDISAAVDGYLQFEPDADARRRGNVMARTRMVVLFDQSAKLDALPVGTGNKTERLLGILHVARRRYAAGQSARRSVQEPSLGAGAVSRRSGSVDRKGAAAPICEADQTDEADLGITYARADAILGSCCWATPTRSSSSAGFRPTKSTLVRRRVDATHWKRHLPTTAMLTNTAINEFYLRPVDY